MKSTTKCMFFGVILVALSAAEAEAAAHHKFCTPQGTKLSSACRSHGYVNGAPAHFKVDRQAANRSRAHHSTGK